MTDLSHRQCLYERRLTARARSLLDRIRLIDATGTLDLERAKEGEIATVELMTSLLAGPYLTVKGWQLLDQYMEDCEAWLRDLETADAGEEMP